MININVKVAGRETWLAARVPAVPKVGEYITLSRETVRVFAVQHTDQVTTAKVYTHPVEDFATMIKEMEEQHG